MKISYNWLKDYLKTEIDPLELASILTNCGLEVEEVALWENVSNSLEGVLIGEVIEKKKHPNADKLSITKVNTGMGPPLQVICGAPNVEQGQKVLIALPGAFLKKNNEFFHLKEIKISGYISEGMICSEAEVGLGDSQDGIYVLPTDATVGQQAKEYFSVMRDWIFTIGLTPNRIDAASFVGVARDIAAVLNTSKGTNLKVKMPDFNIFSKSNKDLIVEIVIEDYESCRRYAGLTIKNLKIASSPRWLADRLSAVGMRCINNVVDITNYVMLELGQPLHAFDMKMVKGNKIVVKKFCEPVDFITLDEVKRSISPQDLMICNAEEPMCIAGVFGGFSYGVTENTTEIFLESAYFDPVSIRKTANRHGLSTESSFRFERGADISITDKALKRAANLLIEIAGGEVSSPVYDIYPEPFKKHEISVNFESVNRLIGADIPKETQLAILKELDFEIGSLNDDNVNVKPPFAKVDVSRFADVVEEILRIYGCNNIPLPESFRTNLSNFPKPDIHKIKNTVSEMLTGLGFYEIMTNSLSPQKYYTAKFGYNEKENVSLLNPISVELNTLRRNLVFSGLESIVHNVNRKQNNLRFFEFGKVYRRISDEQNRSVTEKFYENEHLALFMTGNVFPLNWKYPEEKFSFFHIKDIVEKILIRSGIDIDGLEFFSGDSDIFKTRIDCKLKNTEKKIAEFGELSPKVLNITDCRQVVFFAEIMWTDVIETISKNKIVVREPSKFPEVQRDIAVMLDKKIIYNDIKSMIQKRGGKMVKAIRLFDIYEGGNIPDGKISYAINILLVNEENTLTDAETDVIIDNIKKSLIHNFDAVIR